MERTVEELLKEYKNCTADIIDLLEKESFDSIEDKMTARQCVLNKLVSKSDKKSEARIFYNKLDIKEVEDKAQKLMEKKALTIKGKLNNVLKNKVASNAYVKGINSAKIFSKKI